MGPSRNAQYYSTSNVVADEVGKELSNENRLMSAPNVRRQRHEVNFESYGSQQEIESHQSQIYCLSPSPENLRNYDRYHHEIPAERAIDYGQYVNNLPLSDLNLSGDSLYQNDSLYKHKPIEHMTQPNRIEYSSDEYYCTPDTSVSQLQYYESPHLSSSHQAYRSEPTYNSSNDSYFDNRHCVTGQIYGDSQAINKQVAHHHYGSAETSSFDSSESGFYSDTLSASGYDEEPLDLTTRKPDEEESYEGDLETQEEQSLNQTKCTWLEKIQTGTRSRVRSPKSWEFLVRLLLDPISNPSLIKWEEKQSGTFRLVQKEKIARIWGTRSSKHQDIVLTYDNFARNLRYHYKTKNLVPVSEKHLVYRFSPKVMETYFGS